MAEKFILHPPVQWDTFMIEYSNSRPPGEHVYSIHSQNELLLDIVIPTDGLIYSAVSQQGWVIVSMNVIEMFPR